MVGAASPVASTRSSSLGPSSGHADCECSNPLSLMRATDDVNGLGAVRNTLLVNPVVRAARGFDQRTVRRGIGPVCFLASTPRGVPVRHNPLGLLATSPFGLWGYAGAQTPRQYANYSDQINRWCVETREAMRGTRSGCASQAGSASQAAGAHEQRTPSPTESILSRDRVTIEGSGSACQGSSQSRETMERTKARSNGRSRPDLSQAIAAMGCDSMDDRAKLHALMRCTIGQIQSPTSLSPVRDLASPGL
ncbi:hypothetical protein BJ546DRAFT_950404 [Cryomyces antarcticus]